MSEQWTPTTAEVRAAYVDGAGEYRDLAGEWFDRWLAQVRAEAEAEGLAQGWDEGRAEGVLNVLNAVNDNGGETRTPNPYRTGDDQ